MSRQTRVSYVASAGQLGANSDDGRHPAATKFTIAKAKLMANPIRSVYFTELVFDCKQQSKRFLGIIVWRQMTE